MTRIVLENQVSCVEFKYWTEKSVIDFVDFLCSSDRYIFITASDFISTNPVKVDEGELMGQLFSGLTSENERKYRKPLVRLFKLLKIIYASNYSDQELGSIRCAVVELFISRFVYRDYSIIRGHHCRIQIDGKYIDKNKNVDVAGWKNEFGEFHECKAGDFNFKSEYEKVLFLEKVKKKLGEKGFVAISVFSSTEDRFIKSYKSMRGIDLIDRVGIYNRYLNNQIRT